MKRRCEECGDELGLPTKGNGPRRFCDRICREVFNGQIEDLTPQVSNTVGHLDHPTIIYGPVVERDGFRVTRVMRRDETTFTVRVPPGGRSIGIDWISEDTPAAELGRRRLLADAS